MFWLQTPPWGRWALAALIAAFALWVELRPDPMVDHPFASQPIARGEALSAANTSMRQVPRGLFEPIPDEAVAGREIPTGSPVLQYFLGGNSADIPDGWWVVTVEVPRSARAGDRVRVVVVDTGQIIEGLVMSVGHPDAFTPYGGSIAVPGDQAPTVAAASAHGRVVLLVSPG